MAEKYILTGHTKIFCIIGHPVEHSMSPTMWNPALQELGLDYVYVAFDVHPDSLKKAVEAFRVYGMLNRMSYYTENFCMPSYCILFSHKNSK